MNKYDSGNEGLKGYVHVPTKMNPVIEFHDYGLGMTGVTTQGEPRVSFDYDGSIIWWSLATLFQHGSCRSTLISSLKWELQKTIQTSIVLFIVFLLGVSNIHAGVGVVLANITSKGVH